MSPISMRQKIVSKYQQQCHDKDILPASTYEIQLLIDCAFEALSEPTDLMLSAAGGSGAHNLKRSVFRTLIKAAQEGK